MAGNVAAELKKPANSIGAGSAFIGFCVLLAYPHESFQFIGFTGLQLSGILALLSYDSPSALVVDWSERVAGVAKGVGGAVGAVGGAAAKLPDAGKGFKDMEFKMPDTLAVQVKRMAKDPPSWPPKAPEKPPPPPISPAAQKLADAAAAVEKSKSVVPPAAPSQVKGPVGGSAGEGEKRSPAAQKMAEAKKSRDAEQAEQAKREAAKMVADRSKNGSA